MTCPADPVPSAESGLPTGSVSQGRVPEAYPTHLSQEQGIGDFQVRLLSTMLALIQEMRLQTVATTRLAHSNEALVKAMAEADEGDLDDIGGYTSLSQRAR